MQSIIWIILLGAIIIFTLLILILERVEKNFMRKILFIKRGIVYRIRLRKLKDSKMDSVKTINSLNEIARDFFKEFFDFDYNMDYSELKEKFKEINKPEFVIFCEQMLITYYSSEKISIERANILVDLLSRIIIEADLTKREDKKQVIEKYYFPVEELEKEETVGKIESLLIEGNKSLNEKNYFVAKKIYEEIGGLYSKINYGDKYLYEKIMIFYKRLVKNKD
jgi:hypothetical protein